MMTASLNSHHKECNSKKKKYYRVLNQQPGNTAVFNSRLIEANDINTRVIGF
jgi:hypothetical protein